MNEIQNIFCLNCDKKLTGRQRKYCSSICQKDKWHRDNREHIKAYGQKWHTENFERAKESMKIWHIKNPEKQGIYNKKWYEKNREYFKKYMKAWREKNPTYMKEWYNNKHEQRNKKEMTSVEVEE